MWYNHEALLSLEISKDESSLASSLHFVLVQYVHLIVYSLMSNFHTIATHEHIWWLHIFLLNCDLSSYYVYLYKWLDMGSLKLDFNSSSIVVRIFQNYLQKVYSAFFCDQCIYSYLNTLNYQFIFVSYKDEFSSRMLSFFSSFVFVLFRGCLVRGHTFF